MTQVFDAIEKTESLRAWIDVCCATDLPAGHGVAALVGEKQIACFRTDDGQLFALGNRDPFTGANVMSRGILGSRDGEPTISSPMLKHVFSLRAGCNLDDPDIMIPTYPIREHGDGIQIAAAPW